MYKKILFTLPMLVALSQAGYSQKKNFTMQEAVLGLTSNLAVENLKQLHWIPGTSSYTQQAGTDALVAVSVPGMKTDTLFSLVSLNKDLAGSGLPELKRLPAISWLNSTTAYFMQGNKMVTITLNGTNRSLKTVELKDGFANLYATENGNVLAYTVDNNLYIQNLTQGNGAVAVTSETNKDILSGQSVHRNEFGIDRGIFWSPKGNLLAFYKMDQSMVADYPIVNWNETPAKANNIKYPMAGQTSHQVQLGVYNVATGKTIYLATDKDLYHTCITWSPDEKQVYVALLNRDQNHMWLNQYDAATGQFVKTLFEEQDARYVEPQHALTFVPGKNDQFIWWSQKDGFMHLYLYNTAGKQLKQLTKGTWVVNEILGFNTKNNEVIITAAKESAMEKHAYAVNLGSSAIRRLDEAAGTHTVEASSNGQYLLDSYTSEANPRTIDVRPVKGTPIKTLLQSKNTLTDYATANVEVVTLKAEDGTPLYGKLITPANMDKSKKYPVIVYLYNGPHVQLVKNSFPATGNLWYDYLTQRGYVVFTMDGRGSSNRGMAFESAPFRQLGTPEMNDQLKGVDYLKSLPYVDASRMGVHGWSYGGFMTTSLMLRHPDVFKAAVAGGPVLDWSLYETMYTERYMDQPQTNAEGYANNVLLDKTKNLKGKLLVIHGTDDDVVVWQHSIKLLKNAVDNNVQLDYFVYPGHPHNVRGKDRVHLMQKITDYFDLYLKP
jgi:dipeptidyl-peptidase-4